MELKTFIICALFVSFRSSFSDAADEDGEWGYHHEHGEIPPEEWASAYETCGGQSQSPIDLNSTIAVQQEFSPWVLQGYENTRPTGPRVTSIVNNGHGVTVNFGGNYLVSGGGLPTTYKGLQFHLHWNVENHLMGSEHSRDGQSYNAELHIVHYALQYDSFVPEALTAPEGLAVLGFFIEEGEHNSAWDPIVNSLPLVQIVAEQYEYEDPIQLSSLFPHDDLSNFYRYDGSLTTPGCHESVVWTVFDAPIIMSPEQIAAFSMVSEMDHSEHSEGATTVTDNHRPVQPLNGRTLYAGYAPNSLTGPVGSCVGRCGEVNMELQCQCNSVCRQYRDCCSDYREQCYVEVCSYVPTFGQKRRKQFRPDNVASP